MNVAVIGAGHAGVEAARCLAEAGAKVAVFSADSVLPYFRPRLVAVAFGQAEPDAIRMHPPGWYADRRIDLVLDHRITAGDLAAGRVVSGSGDRAFDGIVMATGSLPVLPPFAAAAPERILPLWNLNHAGRIRRLVRPGGRAVVVGGGILGIEAALRAAEAGMHAVIVECMERLMPVHFGARASAVLLRRMERKGVEVHTKRIVGRALEDTATGRAVLELDNGIALTADICVVAMGARPDLSLAQQAGLAEERGIRVNDYLQTSAPRVFAAGDVVMFRGVSRCSAREAVAQGKSAALNLIALLRGQPMAAYKSAYAPLSFKSAGIELYAAGEPARAGYDEICLDGTSEDVYRAIVAREGRSVGVQMVGSGAGFDELVQGLGKPTG